MKPYLKLLRIPHWLKNGLVLLPLLFAGQLTNGPLLVRTLVGALSFCFVSSFVYIFNDLRDADRDRLHPTKKDRPLASGAAKAVPAIALGICLLIAAGALNIFFTPADSWLWFAAYLAVNLAYSLGLKNVALVDVALLVCGFVLRVMYGGAVSELPVSDWMYLTVISVAFYMSFGKRRNEIVRQGSVTRRVLRCYTKEFLDKNMYVCLALTIVFYALWCLDSNSPIAQTGVSMLWTVPLVMLIVMRYSMDVEGDSAGDPVEVLLSDKLLLVLAALYILLVIVIFYAVPLF